MITATLDEMSAATAPSSFGDEGWQQMLAQTEFGDYNDNVSAYLIMQYAINNGYYEEGMRIIDNLRQQILTTTESKSREWLLPELNSYLHRRWLSSRSAR